MSLRRRNPTSNVGAGFKPAPTFLDRASEELPPSLRRRNPTSNVGAGFKPA